MRRRGFTLIEILIVIALLMLLTGMTAWAFIGFQGQRVRDGARVSQSAILGARDRALHKKSPIGFRLTIDPQNANLGTGFQYIAPIEPLQYTTCKVTRDPMDITHTLIGQGVDWLDLKTEGFITEPIAVRIPSNGLWYYGYNLRDIGNGQQAMDLTGLVPYDDGFEKPAVNVLNSDGNPQRRTCILQPRTEIMPWSETIQFPSGVVIDLANSSANAKQDILFSPRGVVTGPVAASGPIFFLLRDIRDVTEGLDPHSPNIDHRDTLVIALFPLTGHCQSYPVDRSTDMFRYAKLGSQAGG